MRRLGEELLPLLDRANRMTIRTVKALAELQRGPAPAVAINQAGQVNVGAQQVNVTRDGDQPEGGLPARSRPRGSNPIAPKQLGLKILDLFPVFHGPTNEIGPTHVRRHFNVAFSHHLEFPKQDLAEGPRHPGDKRDDDRAEGHTRVEIGAGSKPPCPPTR